VLGSAKVYNKLTMLFCLIPRPEAPALSAELKGVVTH
jgi:hypothetical protein